MSIIAVNLCGSFKLVLDTRMSEIQHIYQAIGELEATLVVAADGTKVLQTGLYQYPVFIPLKLEQKYLDEYQGQLVCWRVYPKAVEQGLAFEVVKLTNAPEIGLGQFRLQGDWIESGQLQIWRNAIPGNVNADNWQPRSLPISWSDAPPADGAFWQLQAELINATLKIVAAEGPFPHPPRLEKLPESNSQRQGRGKPLPKPRRKREREQSVTTETISWEELTSVSGKLELTIKLNSLPQVLKANGECHFKVDCNGRMVQISVKQKQWSKLETASATYPEWVAAIAGQMGAATADGFVLEQPKIQVFERKVRDNEPPKQMAAEATLALSSQQLSATSEVGAEVETKTSQLETKLPEKPDSLAKQPAPQAQPKPKKIGKFDVEVR